MLILIATGFAALLLWYLVFPESYIARLKRLDEMKFEGICKMIDTYGENLTEKEAKQFLVKYEFEPLFKYFLDPNSLSSGEIEKVLELANQFLATGDTMNDIIEFYFENVVKRKVPLPNLYFLGHVHTELKIYLKLFQFGIEVNRKKIAFDEWEVTEEKRELVFQFFRALAPYCESISIKNFSIDDTSFSQLESVFPSNLKQLEFENCPLLFNSENYFDFQHLTSFTNFKLSGFYHGKFLSMLDTIPKDSLIHLDISNIPFDKEEINKLMRVLLQFKELKSFSAPFDLIKSIDWKRPKLTGEILCLPNLKSLNVSGNMDLESFVNELNEVDHLLKLERLNISNNGKLSGDVTFSKNLSKFPALKTLNLSETSIGKLSMLFSNILQLKKLKKFSSPEFPNDDDLGKFVEENGNRQNSLKILNTAWLRSEFLSSINLFRRVCLKYNVLNNFEGNLLPDKFNTTELLIDYGIFIFGNSNSFDILFPKFKKVKFLQIELFDSFQMKYLQILLENNPIEKFELLMHHSVTQVEGLNGIIGARRFKSLKLGFYPRTLYQAEEAVSYTHLTLPTKRIV